MEKESHTKTIVDSIDVAKERLHKEETTELIMSIAILGHGCENLVEPWVKDMPISKYFRENVRVYSRACVPDLEAIGDDDNFKDIIHDIQQRFTNVPADETASIISAYAEETRFDYQKDILHNLAHHRQKSLGPRFDKFNTFENIERASNLSAFLSNKQFAFYNNSPEEKVKKSKKESYQLYGLNVVDIRIKRTRPNGDVVYDKIFSSQDLGPNKFNLIYRSGVIFILQDVLGRPELTERALSLLGFKFRKERITDISLEEIYEFFQLIGVSYANLMDFTCRNCSIGIMPQHILEKIYNVEQKFSIKKTAFGKRGKKRSDKKRSGKKQKSNKRKVSKTKKKH